MWGCDAAEGSLGTPRVVGTGDGDLVRLVVAGDARAYAGLVARHQARLARYARHALGNREDAEEAVQDAFMRAYRSLRRCEDPDGFGPWLFGILVNRCRTRGAQAARRARVVVHDDIAMSTATTSNTDDDAAWGETVDRALARLDPHYREAFLLKHVEDLSYEEMAKITGVGISALKMRTKRACEKLRVMLEEVQRARQ